MKRAIIAGLVFVCLMAAGLLIPKQSLCAASSDGGSPLNLIKATIDDIVKAVEKFPGQDNASERKAKLRELINPRFNFHEMAQRCLGAAWNERTEEERTEFIDIFSTLLANTYLVKIETIKPGMVDIKSEMVEMPKALVRTTVKSSGETFPIDYKLMNENGKWKVYDVVIENIGLVSNYRNEFAAIIRKDKFSGLMVKLRDKVKQSGK